MKVQNTFLHLFTLIQYRIRSSFSPLDANTEGELTNGIAIQDSNTFSVLVTGSDTLYTFDIKTDTFVVDPRQGGQKIPEGDWKMGALLEKAPKYC